MTEHLEKELAVISLKEHLECPVCLELPKSSPIYQCPNGHIVCNICHKKLQFCPQCREPLGKYRCRIAEELMDFEPCSFFKHGCSARFVTKYGKDHEKECQFREVGCPFQDCKKKSSIK